MKSEHLIYSTDLDNCYFYRSRCLNPFKVTVLKLFAIFLYYFVTFLPWCVKNQRFMLFKLQLKQPGYIYGQVTEWKLVGHQYNLCAESKEARDRQ